MKVLVIGKKGQLARSLMERSLERDHFQLTFVGRPQVDLSRVGEFADAIAQARPDIVVNTAAFTDVDRAEKEKALAFRINADGAREIADAAAKIGSPVIQLSTDYVFSGRSDRPWREADATGPLNIYGASKMAGEEMVRDANPNHLIIRTSWVVSPFGRNFINTMMHAARFRESLTVVDDQRGRPTSALDLASAILIILDRWWSGENIVFGRTYHVAGSGETSWYGLAREVMEECSRLGAPAVEVRPIRSVDWPAPAIRPAYSVLDCSCFEGDFFTVLPDWRHSAKEIVARRLASLRT